MNCEPQFPRVIQLDSAIETQSELRSKIDGLPLRDSGPWIAKKHDLLNYFCQIFATGMKYHWHKRYYIELFSGPGKCFVRNTYSEMPGSPLIVIEKDFTDFVFTEIDKPCAGALAQRLSTFPRAKDARIYCGDCNEVVNQIQFPSNALGFAFIDPTGAKHCPFSMIKKLTEKAPRCDLLINIQHAMAIKRNVHSYTLDRDESAAITQFLGDESWKDILIKDPAVQSNPSEFYRKVLDLYKTKLYLLGYQYIGKEVMVQKTNGQNLYMLLFASKHERGEDFWSKAIKGLKQTEFDF